MYLDGLPNECLLIIFRSLNDLDDLISCSKVCERWSHLISHRLYEVKYLTGVQSYCDSFNTVYFGKSDALKESDFWESLPNVKILDIADSNGLNYEDMINILINSKSIKGLVYSPVLTKVMARYCINLEMIATRYSKTYFTDIIIHCGAKLKQLYIWYFSLRHLERFAKYLPCLERLHIDDTSGDTGWLYNGPIMGNLKILEISLESFDKSNIYGGFHLIDFCPMLRSAYFTIYGSSDFFFDETIKNYCLQDLVIQYEIFECGHYWPSLKNFLFKFPNLRHLAIRGNQKIKDNHIKELVHMLPHLIILDVRLSFGITRESAEYIARYCREYNRFLSFYFQHDEAIRLDWPELSVSSNRICRKFDFMKNCFLKPYTELPLLMDPID